MNSATNQMLKDDANRNEPVYYTKPHLALASNNELKAVKLADQHSWEIEVEQVVVLSNN